MICESGAHRGFSRGFDERQPSRERQVSRGSLTETLTRRFAAPSPSGTGTILRSIPLPLGEGAAKRRVRVSVSDPIPFFLFHVFKEFPMRITRFVVTSLLVLTIALPAMASSDWVDDFLRRYQPSAVAEVASNARPPVGQLFLIGTVKVSLYEVIYMLIDKTLIIR